MTGFRGPSSAEVIVFFVVGKADFREFTTHSMGRQLADHADMEGQVGMSCWFGWGGGIERSGFWKGRLEVNSFTQSPQKK